MHLQITCILTTSVLQNACSGKHHVVKPLKCLYNSRKLFLVHFIHKKMTDYYKEQLLKEQTVKDFCHAIKTLDMDKFI